ncbi:MAG TPA: NUDIX hydrolase [Mycobacteriales bacterium]|nr:NUDIX hydrolase [Mycobacteriales bacterium]
MANGDGWVECALGHRHWGVHGAAGLLVVTPDRRVLLQHRAPWSHGGDTWGIPGGALHHGESVEEGARRETAEETAIAVERLVVVDEHVSDHRTWRYTTLVARAPSALPVVPERESVDLRWVAEDDVARLPLHPAFAEAWPLLRSLLP